LLISDYFGGGFNEIGFHNNCGSNFYTAPTSRRLWRAPEADFPPSYFGACEDLPLSPRKPNPQHGVGGTSSRRLQRSQGDAAEIQLFQSSTLNPSHSSPITSAFGAFSPSAVLASITALKFEVT
jgi:hypothetical protein